jgi:hypothetical protein
VALPSTWTDPDTEEQANNSAVPTTRINRILGNLKILGSSAYATLAANDNTQGLDTWNDISCNVTLAAGTWLIIGAITFTATATTNPRYGRIYNNTDAATLSTGAQHAVGGEQRSIAVPPVIVTLAASKDIQLHFYARNTGDVAHGTPGGLAGPACTIAAVRIR